MKRRHFEPRSVNQVVAQIEQVEEALRDPGLDSVQDALLQGAKLALRWALGAESIIPRHLAKRHADQDKRDPWEPSRGRAAP